MLIPTIKISTSLNSQNAMRHEHDFNKAVDFIHINYNLDFSNNN